MHRILSAEAADTVVGKLQGMSWGAGKARTEELTGTVKQNLEILPGDSEQAGALSTAIGKKLINHPSFQLDAIPIMVHPPKFSKYSEGAHYKQHTDAPWMGRVRTDLSCTLWLSDPNTYDGGELCIEGHKPIKGKAGQCLVYDCGIPHKVNPVTNGERVCALTWVQSRIRDSHKRKIVSNLRKLLAEMEPEHKDWFLAGGSVHSSLLRMWSE